MTLADVPTTNEEVEGDERRRSTRRSFLMATGVVTASLAGGTVAQLIGPVDDSSGAPMDERATRLAPTMADIYLAHFGTVAEMILGGLAVGSNARTLGYFAVNDGGGSFYTVVPAATKNYDIPGAGLAFRPVASGVIHPKMFGTINDGTALDNSGLQRCYDYAADLGIKFIDGLGLLYTVGTENSYDKETRGWSHSGAYVKAGRTLSNFKFRTASRSTNGTSPLTLWMENNGQHIYLENVDIDGNAANLNINALVAREDGGCHGIHIYHPSVESVAASSRDFFECGNIYLRNVRMKNIYSYGGRVDHLDCLIELTDCDFDVAGIAFQAHSTRFVVNGANVKAGVPRGGMVPDVFHEEIEFADAYSGSKQQSISINRVRLTSVGGPSRAIFKIHYSRMRGVTWSDVTIDSCEVIAGEAAMVAIYNSTSTVLPIDKLRVLNPRAAGLGRTVEITSVLPDAVKIGALVVDAAKAQNTVLLSQVAVSEFYMEKPLFDADHRIALNKSTIGTFYIRNGTANSLGVFGIIRDSTSTINALVFEGGDYTISSDARYLIDANVSQIIASGLTIRPDARATFGTVFRTTATVVELELRDILMKGSAYRSSSYLVLAASARDGFIYLNNVRHTSGISAPPVSASLLASARKVLVNTSNLY